MITDEQLSEWERLAEAATPGPWIEDMESVCIDPDGGPVLLEIGEFYDGSHTGGHTPQDEKNAAFTAAARTAVPALVAEVRELRRQLEQAQAELRDAQDTNLRSSNIINDQRATVGRLMEQLAQAQMQAESLRVGYTQAVEYGAKREEMFLAQIAEYRAALEWLANARNYGAMADDDDGDPDRETPWGVARAALAKGGQQ